MATTYKYPINTTEELKENISQVDQLEMENLNSSRKLAKRELTELISKGVYNLMMAWYNDPELKPPQPDPEPEPPLEYTADEKKLLDELVELCQGAFANFLIYHHLIFLQIRFSNNGVTTLKNDKETTAFKYQTDEAREKLLDTAHLSIGEIIDFLEENKTFFTQWTGSDQYAYLQGLIIKNYHDFNSQYEISNNAAFFIRTRFLQKEIIDDHILPRFELTDIFPVAPEEGPTPEADVKLLELSKKAVAFKVIALAIKRFDYFLLPESIRKEIGNEFYSSTRFRDIDLVKEKLYGEINTKGDHYLEKIDMYLESKENTDDTVNPYENLDQEFNSDYPFVSII